MELDLALSSYANSGSKPEQLDPLDLDHRGPTAPEASQQRTRTSLRPWVRPTSLETFLPVAAMVNIRGLESHTVSCQDTTSMSFFCTLGRVQKGHPWELSRNMEGLQGRFQKLHYLDSRKLRRAWVSLKQP